MRACSSDRWGVSRKSGGERDSVVHNACKDPIWIYAVVQKRSLRSKICDVHHNMHSDIC